MSKKSPLVKPIMLLVPTLALFVAGYYLGQIFVGEDEANDTESQSGSPPVLSQAEPSGVAYVDPPVQVTDFSLMEDSGDPVRLSDMRGKVVILFFGYTNCPDVCPTTLQDLTVVKEALGEDSEDVEFVFISVDYERDDPQEVAQFLSYFDGDFVGLVGDQQTLSAIGREYGLVIERENINVQHTSPTFLIDRDGYLRQVYFYGTGTGLVTESIQQVVNGSAGVPSR